MWETTYRGLLGVQKPQGIPGAEDREVTGNHPREVREDREVRDKDTARDTPKYTPRDSARDVKRERKDSGRLSGNDTGDSKRPRSPEEGSEGVYGELERSRLREVLHKGLLPLFYIPK